VTAPNDSPPRVDIDLTDHGRDARPMTGAPIAMSIGLPAERVLRTLLWVIGSLILLSTAGRLLYHLGPEFPLRDGAAFLLWVNHEQSFPTLFSVFLLVGCAAAVAVAAAASRRRDLPDTRYWTGLAVIFVVLACDEFLEIHERAIEPVRDGLGVGGLLYNAWVVPAAVVVAAVVVVYGRFVLRLPSEIRRLTIIAAALFVGGAMGMEMLGGWYADEHGSERLGYVPFPTIEEAMEMAGAAVFLSAVLRHLRDHLGGARVTLHT
jgi:hypothetical protein